MNARLNLKFLSIDILVTKNIQNEPYFTSALFEFHLCQFLWIPAIVHVGIDHGKADVDQYHEGQP